jgi:hypothetical protein
MLSESGEEFLRNSRFEYGFCNLANVRVMCIAQMKQGTEHLKKSHRQQKCDAGNRSQCHLQVGQRAVVGAQSLQKCCIDLTVHTNEFNQMRAAPKYQTQNDDACNLRTSEPRPLSLGRTTAAPVCAGTAGDAAAGFPS